MNQTTQALHLNRRRLKAIKIVVNAEQFKVCDQCSSIAVKNARVCPLCGAYRFDESIATVRRVANFSGTCPFPLTSAFVPRISDCNAKLAISNHLN